MSDKNSKVKTYKETTLLCGCYFPKYAILNVDRRRSAHAASAAAVPVICPSCGRFSKAKKCAVRPA